MSEEIKLGLEKQLNELAEQSMKGCGQHYELYAQTFSQSVDRWLQDLPSADRTIAQELANKHSDYFPSRDGEWVHDVEENDIHYEQQRGREPGGPESMGQKPEDERQRKIDEVIQHMKQQRERDHDRDR
jgi:hypothetical protein